MRHEQDEQREDDPKRPKKKGLRLDDSIVFGIVALPALLFFLIVLFPLDSGCSVVSLRLPGFGLAFLSNYL